MPLTDAFVRPANPVTQDMSNQSALKFLTLLTGADWRRRVLNPEPYTPTPSPCDQTQDGFWMLAIHSPPSPRKLALTDA